MHWCWLVMLFSERSCCVEIGRIGTTRTVLNHCISCAAFVLRICTAYSTHAWPAYVIPSWQQFWPRVAMIISFKEIWSSVISWCSAWSLHDFRHFDFNIYIYIYIYIHITIYIPIGSMYGIYANIWGILMVNVTIYIYSIHGSYGIYISIEYSNCLSSSFQRNEKCLEDPVLHRDGTWPFSQTRNWILGNI